MTSRPGTLSHPCHYPVSIGEPIVHRFIAMSRGYGRQQLPAAVSFSIVCVDQRGPTLEANHMPLSVPVVTLGQAAPAATTRNAGVIRLVCLAEEVEANRVAAVLSATARREALARLNEGETDSVPFGGAIAAARFAIGPGPADWRVSVADTRRWALIARAATTTAATTTAATMTVMLLPAPPLR